ncbi:MBL fold metallo-hydrolase [Actinocorallia sp. API 0066]|uniref:MBL fold metallo-hydrolase n=1 Tax=Actinocorallia sp. API 0066 TaxID=2896846 RepID=UPI001E40F62F|nr:MBL fold metallo-hydrolase [Actinocorallia sp. API 0066]MCD0451852.1 MBL fold metallo-hydrolase [Actinocorallia sp. API 0066]
MRAPRITRLSDSAHFVEAAAVNWTILAEGDDVTLIDAGYPADLATVRHSLEAVGHRPEQITAILVTHAHVDHIGTIPALLRLAPKAEVITSPEEAPHVRREYLQQATPLDVVANLWRPGFLGWALHIMKAGALQNPHIPGARPHTHDDLVPSPAEPSDEPSNASGPVVLDVPGRPVPILTPGHTSGHTCYHLPDLGAVVTGDALCTAHPTSRRSGPQLLHPIFNHNNQATRTALNLLSPLPADTVLPGHGPLHRGPVSAAVTTALAHLS